MFLISMSYSTYGQQENEYPFYRVLSTKQYSKEGFNRNKEIENAWRDFETTHLNHRQSHRISSEEFTLAVVFHALYTDDIDRVKTDVDIQLQALNRDYGTPIPIDYQIGYPGASFSNLAESPNIKFKLYNGANANLISDGITVAKERDQKWRNYNGYRNEVASRGKAIPNNVINVWVVKTDDKLGSFAQIPGGPHNTDGIVIDYRTFGSGTAPYNQGKTLTHLMGNYLGLMDLWGMYPCQDDGVADTPVHNSPNYIFPGYRHISTCPGGQVEMTMNFMDNMADEHMWMFTKGQVERLHFMLGEDGPRHHLIN